MRVSATAGIGTDKLLALLGEMGGGVPVQVNLQVNAELLHQRYRELVEAIERRVESAENKEDLPNGETFSDPPATIGFPERKRKSAKITAKGIPSEGGECWQTGSDLGRFQRTCSEFLF